MIKILDICSGIGGFSLGLEATGGFDTVAFCEFDDFCCKVLNKHWPNVPIYKDLKEIGNDPARIIQEFDLICGGIPCQPFSLAGKQKGKEDDRHLWPYMYAIVKSKKPTWVIVENVGGFVNVALDDVCLDLETQGYATQSFIIPACSVEAPHKRDRIWILGKLYGQFAHETFEIEHPDSIRPARTKTGEENHRRRGSRNLTAGSSRSSNDVANAQSNGEDGVLRTTESEHDQGDTRMESSSSSDGRSERGIAQDVANSKELRNYEHDNGERTQQDREHRVSQQPGGEGSLGGTEDVADSKLVSSDSISDSGSNTKTESEQGQKTGNLDRSSGRQDVAYSNSEGLEGSEEAGDTQKSREEREQLASRQDSSLSKGHTQSELGGMADGIPTRLDGHLGFEREPNIPRVATGIPDRVNRLKALGNSIVPQIVYNIGLAILEEEKRTNVTK
jgi:DNA-cytosine methyltransferase